jgi:hypothetical protein
MSDQHDEIANGPKGDAARPDATGADVPDAARRRFATVGLIAPVILTLSGRTAWATGGAGPGGNCSESGLLSGNLSNPGGTCGGEGCSPGYWKNHVERWHPNYLPTAMFFSVFGVNAFPGATLYSVICMNAAPLVPASCTPTSNCTEALKACGMHAVAALQNAATDVSFVYDSDTVKASFASAYASGSKTTIWSLKNQLDRENNMGCPFA